MPDKDDEGRWAEALAALHRGPTAARRRLLRRQRMAVAALSAAIAVALLVPLLLVDRGPDRVRDAVPDWRRSVSLALLIAGMLLIVVGTVRLLREFRGRWTSPLTPLTMRQNKHLVAMVRRTTPADPALVPLARYMADTILRRVPIGWLLGGNSLIWVALGVLEPSSWRLLFPVVLVPVWLGAIQAVRRNERDARRFLYEHPADA